MGSFSNSIYLNRNAGISKVICSRLNLSDSISKESDVDLLLETNSEIVFDASKLSTGGVYNKADTFVALSSSLYVLFSLFFDAIS